jgi:hypothetical protein
MTARGHNFLSGVRSGDGCSGSLRPIDRNADRRCVTSGSGDIPGLIEKELGLHDR